MIAERIASGLGGERHHGADQWTARCPIHTEHTGSFVVSGRPGGAIAVYCLGCGASVAALREALMRRALLDPETPMEGD